MQNIFLGGQDWKKSPAHMLFLSRFLEPRRMEDFTQRDDWKIVLEEDPKRFITKLISENILVEGDLVSRMRYRYKVTELQKLLRERNLKVSGKKDELIERLLENDNNGMEKLVSGLHVLLCTEKGRAIAEEYIQREKVKREIAEQQTIHALRNRKFRDACLTVARYEAEQVFQRGMGMDWKNYKPERDIKVLELIFSSKPNILKGLDTPKYEDLWIVAGMMHLWGTNRTEKSWINEDFETGIRFDVSTAARMIWFNAQFKEDLKEFHSIGSKVVFIRSGVNDDLVCEYCKKMDGKKFKISDVPEMPLENCTSEMGCRCMISPFSYD